MRSLNLVDQHAETSSMGTAQLHLRHNARQRILAGYGGAIGFAASAAVVWWVFTRALTGVGLGGALLLVVWLVAALRIGSISVRTARHTFAQPSIFVEDGRLVIEDPTTLEGPQSIPFDLIQSIHIGPEVAGWMVGTYATRTRSDETQLGRFPQLPNAVIVLTQPVSINQARRRMLRLWHLSAPPSPTRPTSRIWATVADHDAAFLVFADRGFQPDWATADDPLAVWD